MMMSSFFLNLHHFLPTNQSEWWLWLFPEKRECSCTKCTCWPNWGRWIAFRIHEPFEWRQIRITTTTNKFRKDCLWPCKPECQRLWRQSQPAVARIHRPFGGKRTNKGQFELSKCFVLSQQLTAKSQINATPQYVLNETPHNFCCNFSPFILSFTM